jgi:hypothetical protein
MLRLRRTRLRSNRGSIRLAIFSGSCQGVAVKATPILFLSAVLFCAGCGQDKSNPVTAPVDYVGTAVKQEQKAIKTVDTTSLNQAVQLFNVQEGRYPKDLNELVEKKYIGKLPDAPVGMKLSYDSAAGKVTVEKE